MARLYLIPKASLDQTENMKSVNIDNKPLKFEEPDCPNDTVRWPLTA